MTAPDAGAPGGHAAERGVMTAPDARAPGVRAAARGAVMAGAIVAGVAIGGSAAAGEDTPHTLFMLHCSGCHLPDGTGMTSAGIPPFPGIVGRHLHHPDGRKYLANVPGVINAGISDADTARLLNWILDTWGAADRPKDARPFTAEEIGRLRGRTVDDIFALRTRIAADLKKRGLDIGRYP